MRLMCSGLYSMSFIFRTGEARGAQYLMGPKVWQAVEHSMSQVGILFLPQFEQQNRDEGGNLQTHVSLDKGHTKRNWVRMLQKPPESTLPLYL